jgi:hypothetical protein
MDAYLKYAERSIGVMPNCGRMASSRCVSKRSFFHDPSDGEIIPELLQDVIDLVIAARAWEEHAPAEQGWTELLSASPSACPSKTSRTGAGMTGPRILAPGTPIYGDLRDGSAGCWTASRADTEIQIEPCRTVGLTVISSLVAKMRSEELEEVPHG